MTVVSNPVVNITKAPASQTISNAPQKVLIIGHSIVRRFNQFLNDDDDVQFDSNMGSAATHMVYYKGTGGCKIDGILCEDAHFLRRIKPYNLPWCYGINLSFHSLRIPSS